MITQNALLSSHADLTRRPVVDYSAPGGWLLVSLYRGNKVHGRLRQEAWRSVTYAESDHGRTRHDAHFAPSRVDGLSVKTKIVEVVP